PGKDVGVGHPYDGRERVRLATAVPGRLYAHLGGAQPVLEEYLQHAGTEQLGPLGGLALVVEIVRAPAVRDRRVVHPVDQVARAPFTDERAIHGSFLVDGVGLERVPDRFMEEDPTTAVRDDDRHLAGRRGDR